MVSTYQICVLVAFIFLFTQSASDNLTKEEIVHVQLVGWQLHDLRIYLEIAVFAAVIITVKILYFQSKCVPSYIPESSIFILAGIIFGVIYDYNFYRQRYGLTDMFHWASSVFMYILLPPIVLDASMTLCNRVFFDIVLAVLFFAFIGTILNFLIIGFLLLLVNFLGGMDRNLPDMRPIDFFWFSSILVAVDPVAVLAIFEEIHVDQVLYFYVFGESLYNDAVSIVLYKMMGNFQAIPTIDEVDICFGIIAFILVSVGGACIGMVFGLLTCLVTRLTSRVAIMEPATNLCLAYFSYIIADLVQWSSLISLITCGMVQTYYAFHNMSSDSVITLHRTIKMAANLSESIVFIGIGFLLIHQKIFWYTGFILWSLFFMLLARFVVCFASCFCLNVTEVLVSRISFKDQFFMSYGGLRGAVSCVLALDIVVKSHKKSTESTAEIFHTSATVIIIFTVVLIGFTMRPLMKLFKVKVEQRQVFCIFSVMGSNVCDHLAAGLEAIEGRKGRNTCREWMSFFDVHYIRPILQNSPDSHDEGIVKEYENVALAIHYSLIKPKEKTSYLSQLSEPLRIKLSESHKDYCDEHDRNDAEESDLSDVLEYFINQEKRILLKNGGEEFYNRLRVMLARRSKAIFQNLQTNNSHKLPHEVKL